MLARRGLRLSWGGCSGLLLFRFRLEARRLGGLSNEILIASKELHEDSVAVGLAELLVGRNSWQLTDRVALRDAITRSIVLRRFLRLEDWIAKAIDLLLLL